MNPVISIITVNLNNARGLEQTILSVIKQSYTAVQYIVIDGGSTDNSRAVIEQYSGYIQYAVSEKDNGIYQAMNKGIARAIGDYLLFLNSGDVIHPGNPLQMLVDKAEDADIVYGNIRLTDEHHNRDVIFPAHLSFKFFYINSLPHSCTLIKRDLFERIGVYREDLKVAADWAFFILAMCRHNARYRHVDIIVADFQLGGISTTHQAVIEQERELIMKEYFPAFAGDYKEMFETEDELVSARKQLGYRVHRKIRKLFFDGR